MLVISFCSVVGIIGLFIVCWKVLFDMDVKLCCVVLNRVFSCVLVLFVMMSRLLLYIWFMVRLFVFRKDLMVSMLV